MSITASNLPQSLPCGVIDQQWLNQLNDYRMQSALCILANQGEIQGLRDELPSIICNYMTPRLFAQTVRVTENSSMTINIPTGGTWTVMIVVDGAEGNPPQSGTFFPFVYGASDTDDDREFGGSSVSTFAGGTPITITAPNNHGASMSVFAFRTDCP